MKKSFKALFMSCIISATAISIPLIATGNVGVYKNGDNTILNKTNYSTTKNNNDPANKTCMKLVMENLGKINYRHNDETQFLVSPSKTIYVVDEQGISYLQNDRLVNILSDPIYNWKGAQASIGLNGHIYVTFHDQPRPDGRYLTERLFDFKIDFGHYINVSSTEIYFGQNENTKSGKTYHDSNGDIFFPNGETIDIVSGHTIIPWLEGKYAKDTFDEFSTMTVFNNQLFVLTKYGLFVSDDITISGKHKLTLINSILLSKDRKTYIKIIDNKIYLKGSVHNKENKIFLLKSIQNGTIEEVPFQKNETKKIGGLFKLQEGKYLLTDEDGIYINELATNSLDSNIKWKKIFTGDWSSVKHIMPTGKEGGFYIYGENFGSSSVELFKVTNQPNPDSQIDWEKDKNDKNKVLIKSEVYQHGARLQYKNGEEWNYVPLNKEMQIENKKETSFRWVPDRYNKLMRFNLGDASGNTYTQDQLDLVKDGVKAAPEGAEAGDEVTQANIDKRNGFTLKGDKVYENKKIELFNEPEFGIEDDRYNPDDKVSTVKNIHLEKEFNQEYVENGNSLNFETEIYASLTDTYHPSLKKIRENALFNGNKEQKFKVTINIIYIKNIDKFYFKLSTKDLSSALLSNNVSIPFTLAPGESRNLGFLGRNKQNSESGAGWTVRIEKSTKNNDAYFFHLQPYIINGKGEDAFYYKSTRIVSAKSYTQHSLTHEQISAANAKFKARKEDKIRHIYTEDEIWMRDHGSKMNKDTILGFNDKNVFVINIKRTIPPDFQEFIHIAAKDVEAKINEFLKSEYNPVFASKDFLDNELDATNEVLGLNPDWFEVPPGQSLHNGLNTIIIRTKKDNYVTFADGSTSKTFNILIVDKFLIVINKFHYKHEIYHDKNEEFEVTDSILEITNGDATVGVGQTLKWGINKIKLFTKAGFLFSNHKNYIIISITVYQYSEKQTNDALQVLKDQLENMTLKNQGFIKVSQIVDEINNADSLVKKLKLLQKWTNLTIKYKEGNTAIVDVVARSNSSGELELVFATYSKNTIFSVHNFSKKLQGVNDTDISNYTQKVDHDNFVNVMSNANISSKKQGYRLLSDVASTIIDSDSLLNLLGIESVLKLKSSTLSSVSATADSLGKLKLNIVMSTFGATTPDLNITNSFMGKTDLEINAISTKEINLAQKNDIKNINSQLSNSELKFDQYESIEELNDAGRKVTDVSKLKKVFGIDLNIDLQASIIKRVETNAESDGDVVVKIHVRSYRASDSKIIITKEYKNIFQHEESSIIKNLPAIIIISIVVTLSVITGLLIIKFKSNKRMLY
ncbi:MAG: hypothetical protein GY679_03265 [Mycoplasma sp.]|nr:hypothetical protein [Mycoplasma sp.]